MDMGKSWSFRRLYQPIYRTLRVDILTLFLSLFIVSFSFIIFFTYIKHKSSIEAFSLGTVSRASSVILEKVEALVLDAKRIPWITDSILWNIKDISADNEDLILYLLRVVQVESNFSHIFVSSTEGNFIGASDLRYSTQHNYMTNNRQSLPSNARFSLFFVDKAKGPNKNTWIYFDENLQPICSEEYVGDAYDPRQRPWYIGAMQAKGAYWTNVYSFYATGDMGISVSQPLYDKSGNIIGVTGVDLTFTLLSEFLNEQKVGESGHVFLLDNEGENLIDERYTHSSISAQSVAKARSLYLNSQQTSFLFESQGIKYLAYVDKIPVIRGKHWLIMIIVPHMDFFTEIYQTQKMVSLIAVLVLTVSGTLVFYFSNRISKPIVALSQEVDKIKRLDLTSQMRVESNIKEIMLIDNSIATLRTALGWFACYVPRKVVQQLIEKGEEIALGGEKKEITVLFSDIASFTSYSEENPTETVMEFLAEYFDRLSKIILQEEGIIDKYVGDGIMAFWGAPLETGDHAIKACNTAICCQAYLEEFNKKRKHLGLQEFFTRIAIDTGTVIVGNIGTLERMNYTAIGDTVNTAAHLQ